MPRGNLESRTEAQGKLVQANGANDWLETIGNDGSRLEQMEASGLWIALASWGGCLGGCGAWGALRWRELDEEGRECNLAQTLVAAQGFY